MATVRQSSQAVSGEIQPLTSEQPSYDVEDASHFADTPRSRLARAASTTSREVRSNSYLCSLALYLNTGVIAWRDVYQLSFKCAGCIYSTLELGVAKVSEWVVSGSRCLKRTAWLGQQLQLSVCRPCAFF